MPDSGVRVLSIELPGRLDDYLPLMEVALYTADGRHVIAPLGSLVPVEPEHGGGVAIWVNLLVLGGRSMQGHVAQATLGGPQALTSSTTGQVVGASDAGPPVVWTGGGGPVGGFAPTSGGEGDQVLISGSFSAVDAAYDAIDAVVVGEGPRGFVGRVTSLQSTSIEFGLDHVAIYAEAKPLTLRFGSGKTVMPVTAAVSFPGGLWAMEQGAQDSTLNSTQLFGADGGSIYQECGDVPDRVSIVGATLDEVNQLVRIQLPGFGVCEGDTVSGIIHLTSGGSTYFVVLPTSTEFPQSLAWDTVGRFTLVNALNQLFAVNGSMPLVASYNASQGDLEIRGTVNPIDSVAPGSFLQVSFLEENHTLWTDLRGNKDAYETSDGPENSNPHTDFLTWYNALGGQEPVGYDYPALDDFVAETFDSFGSTGDVRAATLSLRIQGNAAQTYTDSVNLGWNGDAAWDWGVSLNQMPDVGDQWNIGDDVTVCFDLSQLYRGGELTNIVDRLNENKLHVLLQDDTKIDFWELKVWRCNQ